MGGEGGSSERAQWLVFSQNFDLSTFFFFTQTYLNEKILLASSRRQWRHSVTVRGFPLVVESWWAECNGCMSSQL